MPWDRKTARHYGDIGPQHHLEILGTEVPRLFGNLEGHRVLDFGCGPGHFAIALAEAGAARVEAIDENPEMVARARKEVKRQAAGIRDRIVIRRGNENDIAEMPPFDAVLSSLALMMCRSRQRLHATCRALVDALRPDGRLLVVLTHPCFRGRDYGTFHYELPDDYDYWSSGTAYDVVLTPDSRGDPPVITDYHWQLQDYVTAFADAGAAVTRLLELPAMRRADNHPQGPPAYLALLLGRWRKAGAGSLPAGQDT
jgi:SAM-dependent methyltransferase